MSATNVIRIHMGSMVVGHVVKTVRCVLDAMSKNAQDVKVGTYYLTVANEIRISNVQ